MAFQQAYLTESVWNGPDGTLPVDQSVATLHFTASNRALSVYPCMCMHDVGESMETSVCIMGRKMSLCVRPLTFPIPGFSFTLDTARRRHGGVGGGETCRMPLKLVG